MVISLIVVVFWLSLAAIVHTYLVFPVVLAVLASLNRKDAHKQHPMLYDDSLPYVTVVMSAFNEERNIRDRIENLASCTYPAGKMTVLVGSDGSTDSTNAILEELSGKYHWLTVRVFPENRGKTPVLNSLVSLITTPITILTDADTVFSSNALVSIVQPFSQPTVGCVAGVRKCRTSGTINATTVQESSYLDIDNKIRIAEGVLGCVIGAHGSLYAIRTELLEKIPEDRAYTDDFYLSMIPLERGFTVVQANEAISFAETATSTLRDFRRKVRYSSTAFATCSRFASVMWSAPLSAAYCFFSHRVSRWYLPFFLLTALISNVVLYSGGLVYQLLLWVQISFYVSALVGVFSQRAVKASPLFSLSAYFVYSNAALFVGFFRWLFGNSSNRWVPSRS